MTTSAPSLIPGGQPAFSANIAANPGMSVKHGY
jgi:hypothetical protein